MASSPTLDLTLTRTIHPVGQGALYSETFSDSNNQPVFTAVYDCGGKKDYVGKEIQKLSTVDLLFISHFHSDHINGVPDLIKKKSVKRVVFPQISFCRFFVDFVFNCMREIKDDIRPACSFMLRMLPIISSANSANGSVIWDDGIEYTPVTDGETGLPFPTESPLWEYIAFYKEELYEDNSLYQNLLSILGLDDMRSFREKAFYEEIAKSLKDNEALFDKVKLAYQGAFPGGHNSYSMPVLSHYIGIEEKNQKVFDCLYTGDAIIENWVVEIVNGYRPNYIQVPHHGSNHNHNPNLYITTPIAFISVGETNRYRHPGLKTLLDLSGICKEVHIITEDSLRAFVSIIVF